MSEEDPGIAWRLINGTGGHGVYKGVDTGDNPRRATGRIPPKTRVVTIDGQTLYAVDANDLLEYDSIGNYGRPGQPY